MLLIDPSRAYERALLSGIAHYSHLHGPWIFFREAPFWEQPSRKALLEQIKTVDGIIMREGPYLGHIRKLHMPAIVSNSVTEHIPCFSNIVSDHEAIGQMAAQHLLERGFRHFAFCGYPDLFWSAQRCQGFETGVAAAGLGVHIYRPPQAANRVWKKEQQYVMKWLRLLPKPVGLMTCIDERSQQVAEACKKAAILVPDQVAIIGVDNDEMICTLSSTPLSSVAITAEKGGYDAAALLDRLMRSRRQDTQTIRIRPSHVVTRSSTDIVAVPDPHVARALTFIRDNCRRELYVDEVASAAGLSRRVLEKRVREVLNRSINEHIRRTRVEIIVKMLVESSLTISEIATSTGFSDAAHIARYFRSQTGISTEEYRRQYHP
ncbi:MAG: DNA-binding transcriptional regulator [bacterium]